MLNADQFVSKSQSLFKLTVLLLQTTSFDHNYHMKVEVKKMALFITIIDEKSGFYFYTWELRWKSDTFDHNYWWKNGSFYHIYHILYILFLYMRIEIKKVILFITWENYWWKKCLFWSQLSHERIERKMKIVIKICYVDDVCIFYPNYI